MAAVETDRMTVEEFFALPDDGIERMLIDGVVRELGMTRRNSQHSAIESNVTYLLKDWLSAQPRPRGRVVGGEAGFRLGSGRAVGVDVAYLSPEVAAANPLSDAIHQGYPTLAVEILSPSDRIDNVQDKIAAYLQAGVALVWVIQHRFETVTVYRPDAPPRLYNTTDEIDAEPHLPGFRTRVTAIFED